MFVSICLIFRYLSGKGMTLHSFCDLGIVVEIVLGEEINAFI